MSLNTRLRGKTPILPSGEREIAVLRLLGRLGPTLGQTIGGLYFFDRHPATVRKILGSLTERRLTWRASLPTINDAGRSSGRPFAVYGLTNEGQRFLNDMRAEPRTDVVERLIIRSRQASLPLTLELSEETYISNWCASLLDQVRRTPMFVGAEVQRHYTIANTVGNLTQTIGTLIVLAFDGQRQTYDRPTWDIPLLTDGFVPPNLRVVRLALEVDTGIQGMRYWFNLAQLYRRCADAGLHKQILGGAVHPVIITTSAQRIKMAGEQWIAAWPNSPARITHRGHTAHSKYGVLWGRYYSLQKKPIEETHLLDNLLGTFAQWPTQTKQWSG